MVLRALPDADGPRQVQRLADVTGIPRPTVYRLLAQLHEVGAVERLDGRYQVDPRMADLARRRHPIPGFRESAAQVMRALREQTGATVSLIVPTESGAIALDVVRGRESLPVDIYAGRDMPSRSAGVVVLQGRRRTALDDGDLFSELTCYGAAVTLAQGRRASLAITTTVRNPSAQYAALTQQAAERIGQLSHPFR